ncbi:MAG TPA: hypothetical protein VGF67_27715 [Ktedonobacteraceae bacterium]|jgi:site-specific DNA-methyltransferase (adenine-specific)
MSYTLHYADCLEWLGAQAENSLEAIVTDPPYGLKEYSDGERDKLKNGKRGGIWRIPPAIGGSMRSPLPRFTVLNERDLKDLYQFFTFGEIKCFVWLYLVHTCLSQQTLFCRIYSALH